MNKEPEPIGVEGIDAKFHPEMVELLGENLIRSVADAFNDPLNDELQAVVFGSELSHEEQIIYLESSPDLHGLRLRLLSLENDIAKVLLPEFDKKLGATVASVGNGDQVDSFKQLALLFDFVNSFRQFLVPGTNMKNMRVMELVSGLIQRMFFESTSYFVKEQCDMKKVNQIRAFFIGLLDFLSEQNGCNYSQLNLQSAVNSTRYAVDNNFQEFLAFIKSLPDVDEEVMLEDIVAVDDLISTRRQSFTAPVKIGKFVFVPPVSEAPLDMAFTIVSGAIMIDESQTYMPPIRTSGYSVEQQYTPGAIELYVDRSLHELCLPLTHFPLQMFFETYPLTRRKRMKVYSKLKSAFYHNLVEYLRGLPEDPKLALQADVTVETIDGVHKDIVVVSGLELEPILEEASVVVKKPRKFTRGECTGFKSGEVQAILMRILGEPVRVNGSHYFFKGENGLNPPISLHCGSVPVDPGALFSNICVWGIVDEWRKETGRG